ncbi:MAG TPA: DUF3616 domain-containing protein [Thermoanaerobaculia bacterium]|nr:DUF3616 domain-containing protein [Thermoanaerobaculia bacterium]
MARQIPLWTGTAVLLLVVGGWLFGTASSPGASPGATAGKTFAGEIPISEISGAAFLPDGRLLAVSDEGNTIFLLEKAAERLKTGKLEKKDFQVLTIPGKRAMDDLEDVAWDRQSGAFLVTSHSLNKKGKGFDEKPERFAIVRLPLGQNGGEKLPVFDLQAPQELKASTALTPAKSGFNVEGAAWSQDGRLLLGLRSPLGPKLGPNGNAIVLEVKNPGKSPLQAEVKARLDLNGGGIRGMFYDPEEKGFWILAGLSPDPEEAVEDTKRSLWLWRDNGALEPRTLPEEAQAFANAETVTRVSMGGQPYLLLVEDAKVSRYLLFPVPRK